MCNFLAPKRDRLPFLENSCFYSFGYIFPKIYFWEKYSFGYILGNNVLNKYLEVELVTTKRIKLVLKIFMKASQFSLIHVTGKTEKRK